MPQEEKGRMDRGFVGVCYQHIYIYAHNYTICQCDVIGLEAIASRLEAIAIRLATASRYKHIDI